MKSKPVIQIRRVYAGYGNRPALDDISAQFVSASVTAIIGHNGAGKSTLLRVASGVLRPSAGDVIYGGGNIQSLSSSDLRKGGLVYSPQGQRVFRSMTVEEQIRLAAKSSGVVDIDVALDEVIGKLPELRKVLHRRGGVLSGGERQTVSFAMALVGNPRALLVDEPSYGLAPHLVDVVLERIRALADEGCAVVVVEQRVRDVLRISDNALVLRRGKVSFRGSARLLRETSRLEKAFL